MLLAGGQGSRLYALTQNVAKPSMPFGGKYRIIDFPLSNCANSGIDTVGVLTQYRPLQLNSHIGSGQAWDMDTSDGGVFILPPYLSAGEKGSWFSGTANAIYQNISFIEMYDPDNVLILSGDHVYKMDYSLMLREHVEKDAACTISVLQVSMLITHLQQTLHDDPNRDFLPCAFVFGAKAAAGYKTAKRIIELLCSLQKDIAADPLCKDRLQVYFMLLAAFSADFSTRSASGER